MGFVDTADGNLHLSIPLGSFPQRSHKQSEPVTLEYDSNIWQVNTYGSTYWTPTLFNSPGVLGLGGWRLKQQASLFGAQTLFGSLGNCTSYFTWYSFAGTRHTFLLNSDFSAGCPTTAVGWALDSSGYSAFASESPYAYTIYAPDGTLVFEYQMGGTHGTPMAPNGKYLATQDPNGNYLSADSGFEWLLSPTPSGGFYDTLGRTIVFVDTTAPCNSTTLYCYNVPNSQGGVSTYKAKAVQISMKTQFGESGVAECVSGCTMSVIQQLTLPDGSTYLFKYDCDSSTGNPACGSPGGRSSYYGQLMSMTKPSGAQITYGYTVFTDAYSGKTSWLRSRTSTDGSWTYVPTVLTTCSPTQVGCQQKTTVTRPTGDSTTYTFTLNNGAWPTNIVSKDQAGKTLSTISKTWDFTHNTPIPYSYGAVYITLLEQQTTYPMPTGQLTQKTQYRYDSPTNGNVISIKEWRYYPAAFPSIPDRSTYITYLTTGIHDINRPTLVIICANGTDSNCTSGMKVAQTSVTYDGYGSNGSLALELVTGAISHDDANFGTTYLTRGNATQISRWVSTTATPLTTAMSYDTTGQLVKVMDPNQNAAAYSYSDAFYDDNGANPPAVHSGAPKTNAGVTTIADSIGSTLTGYYYGSGLAAFSVDYNGVYTYGHYLDTFDRRTETDYPIGWALTTYGVPAQSQTAIDFYAAVGDAGSTGSVSCTLCAHSQTLLDGLGRPVALSLVNNPAGESTVNTAYDALSRVSSSSHPHIGTGDPNNVSETARYDGLGRSVATLHPDGESSQIAYGDAVGALGGLTTQQSSASTYGYGFPVLSQDEAGKQRQEWIDGFGRVIEVDEPASGGLTSPYVTTYLYNVVGNLTSVTQGSQTRMYQYDGLSRLTQETTPEAGTVTYSYVTTYGALCSGALFKPCSRTAPAPNQTGAATVTTTYTYNTANQLTQKTHSDTTGNEAYTYGASGAAFNIGRLTNITDASGSESYTYDQMGRVKNLTKIIDGATYATQYTYNSAGQLGKLTYPSGRVVFYNHDNVGHLCQIATTVDSSCSSASPYLNIPSSSYDASGRPLRATYGNGVVATAAYSPNTFEMTSLGYTKGTTTLVGLNYYYEKDPTYCPSGNAVGNNGQIQCIQDISSGTGSSGRSVAYTYDLLGRLSTAQTTGSAQYPVWGLSWTYDRYANRTAQTVTAGSGYNVSLTINPANNQITGYGYDAAGNITAFPSNAATFVYDAEECNTGYTGNGSSATYTCDGNHSRVKKVVTGTNAVTTVSVRSGGQLIAEYDNGAAVTSPTREYLYGRSLLATVTRSTAGGTIIYQHRDHLSPRLYTDVNGNNAGEQGSYPFGESWYNNTTSNWVFTTYERDKESGNDYAMARSYAGTQGRFLAPDPLGGIVSDPQSWNRYAYVANDPVNRSDPSGQNWFLDALMNLFRNLLTAETLGTVNMGNGPPLRLPPTGTGICNICSPTPSNPPIFTDDSTGAEPLATAAQIPDNIKVAIEKSKKESDSKNSDDKKGGFHETSGMAAPAASGDPGSSVHLDVIPAIPGKAADPRKEGGAQTTFEPADPTLLQTRPRIAWHVHPRGVIGDCGRETCYVFNQPPSDVDKLGADPSVIDIVVGARNNRVYIYNSNGAVRSYSWKQFVAPNYIPDVIIP